MSSHVLDHRYRTSPDVLCQIGNGEAVLLDLAGEEYFGLDPVGTRVWELLGEGATGWSVVDAIAAQFAVERDVVAADVAELLEQLDAAALVRRDAH